MLFNLSEQNSLANHYVSELRDKRIQGDRPRFRRNVERLGQIMAYELSKHLPYRQTSVDTPLGTSSIPLLSEMPLLVTVLRAGLPYFQGFLDYFDHCDCGFIGAYRREGGNEVSINLDYLATPSVQGRCVIMIDPMLATGKSFVRSVEALTQHGAPLHIHIVSLIAVPEGLNFIAANLTLPHSIWTCAVDDKLNNQFYIVPGLGDAGDLSYGPKI